MSARKSAGAEPGPPAMAAAATAATVTDANLVLGRLDPKLFHGGQTPLDVTAARTAVSRYRPAAGAFGGRSRTRHHQSRQCQYGERHRHSDGAARHRCARICPALVRRRRRRACRRSRGFARHGRGHRPAAAGRILGTRSAGGGRASRLSWPRSVAWSAPPPIRNRLERLFHGMEEDARRVLASEGFSGDAVRLVRSVDLKGRRPDLRAQPWHYLRPGR